MKGPCVQSMVNGKGVLIIQIVKCIENNSRCLLTSCSVLVSPVASTYGVPAVLGLPGIDSKSGLEF